jgi:hypothetical protein
MLYLKLAQYVPAIVDILAEIVKAARKDSDGGKKITPEEADKIKLVAANKVKLIIDDILTGEL